MAAAAASELTARRIHRLLTERDAFSQQLNDTKRELKASFACIRDLERRLAAVTHTEYNVCSHKIHTKYTHKIHTQICMQFYTHTHTHTHTRIQTTPSVDISDCSKGALLLALSQNNNKNIDKTEKKGDFRTENGTCTHIYIYM